MAIAAGSPAFDAILTPGDMALLLSWRDDEAPQTGENAMRVLPGARVRRVRVIRAYGMFGRREATQYYPDVARAEA